MEKYNDYLKQYFKTRCKRINLILDNEKDADIIDALEGKNISKTVRELMRKGLKSKNV